MINELRNALLNTSPSSLADIKKVVNALGWCEQEVLLSTSAGEQERVKKWLNSYMRNSLNSLNASTFNYLYNICSYCTVEVSHLDYIHILDNTNMVNFFRTISTQRELYRALVSNIFEVSKHESIPERLIYELFDNISMGERELFAAVSNTTNIPDKYVEYMGELQKSNASVMNLIQSFKLFQARKSQLYYNIFKTCCAQRGTNFIDIMQKQVEVSNYAYRLDMKGWAIVLENENCAELVKLFALMAKKNNDHIFGVDKDVRFLLEKNILNGKLTKLEDKKLLKVIKL